MAILPVQLARVSDLLRSSTATGQIAITQQSLLEVQNQLATGKRVNSPSDDPAAATIIQELQKTLDTRQAYATNLQQANSQLGEVDTTLGSLSDLLQQAQTIASANVGSDVTADQRKGAAAIVQTLYTQALSIGNTQFEGSFIFGGTRSTTPPFVDSGGTVKFTGSTDLLHNEVDSGALRAFQVDGNQVFGALSTRVQGATNLAPSISAATRLADLGGAQNDGVVLGSIQIDNGAGSQIVDLTKADTIGDVVNTINAANIPGVTAAIGPTGINLVSSSGANISVAEVGGGGPAASLGLLTATPGGPGVQVTGAPLNGRVTPLTPLADLRGGAGIDPAGLTITNGGASATIDLSGATTVEDLLNAVNGSKTGVLARINSAGDGIDIVNSTQGTALAIAENGGQTAEQLGVRSFSPTTSLSELNNGNGVATAAGGDFQVTRKDGTSFTVSVAGLNTVQDVIDAINAADGGGGVTASFATTGNGIVIDDATGGGSALSITAINASSAAKDLGLLQSSAGATLTGIDVNAVQPSGVLANLAKLRDALQGSDQAGITAAAQELKTDYDRVVGIRGANGAQVQELQSRQSKLDDENVATKSLLSNLQDTDFTTAITQFQTLQTQLQANYQIAAKTLHQSLLDFLG